ncbi:MAG: rhodanese-like domain-containing protein [Pseudomonadota bacterium]
MTTDFRKSIDVCDPPTAWSVLTNTSSAHMVDVRTRAEWGFVGIPDLQRLNKSVVFVEWRSLPEMAITSQFAEQVLEAFGEDTPSHLLFICRSGARSMEAAQTVAEKCTSDGLDIQCTNIAEGFEGDLNGDRHRGTVNGWKAHGLPWVQN